MEQTFSMRNAALGLGFTIFVFGVGFALAMW